MSSPTLRLLRASEPAANGGDPDNIDPKQLKAWFENVSADLSGLSVGPRDPVVIDRLANLFDALAEMTLSSATSITRRDRTSERWNQTQRSS